MFLKYLLRTGLFTCVSFTLISVGQFLYQSVPAALPAFLAAVAGMTVAYIMHIFEANNE